MAMTPKLYIAKVVFFSDGIKNEWLNPEAAETNTKHVIVLVDTSGSMWAHVDELRVALSFMKALGGMPSLPLCPRPKGPTDLLGALDHVIDAPTGPPAVDASKPQVIVFTDGYDNKQRFNELAVGWDAAGAARLEPLQSPTGDLENGMRRQRLVLEHATEYLGAHIALIGIGTQVSKLLKLADKLPITVGKIEPLADDATDADKAERVRDVCQVIRKVAMAPPRKKGEKRAVASTAPKPSTMRTEAEAAEIAQLVPDSMVTAVRTSQSKVRIGGVEGAKTEVTHEEWLQALREIEDHLELHPDDSVPEDKRDAVWHDKLHRLALTRAALLFFLEECLVHSGGKPLAGGLIGGKMTSLMHKSVKDKFPGWGSKFNQLLSALKGSLLDNDNSFALLRVESSGKDADGNPVIWQFTRAGLKKPLKYKEVALYAPLAHTEAAVRHFIDNPLELTGALPREEFLKHTALQADAAGSSSGEASGGEAPAAEPAAKRARVEA